MIKSYFIKAALTVTLISSLGLISCTKNDANKFELELINTSENSWGYKILSGNRTFICQEFIPCIEGNNPFASKSDAKHLGQLVLVKLQNNQMPTCTLEELKRLNIVQK